MELKAIIKPYCDGCPERDMAVVEDSSVMCADGRCFGYQTVVRCTNFKLCTRLERMLLGTTAPLETVAAVNVFSADTFTEDPQNDPD